MSTPFLTEIRIFSFGFAPKGWAACNGQLLPINSNQAMFSLLGTTYGGDGRTTFGLPNLQGRRPMHVGAGHVPGEVGGEDGHVLSIPEMPGHTHSLRAKAAASPTGPAGRQPGPTKVLAEPHAVTGTTTTPVNIYGTGGAGGQIMAAATIGNGGASQPHENRPPYLALNICMALQGIFPSRN